jgi:hypothetical protein
MAKKGWLSHPLAAMKIGVPGPGEHLGLALRSTHTYQAFQSGQTPARFDHQLSIPAILTYLDRNGTITDRILLDRAAGLMMHIDSISGHRTIAFLDDVESKYISYGKAVPAVAASLNTAQHGATFSIDAQRAPTAIDIATPPERIQVEINRIIRDTATARSVKLLHSYRCQICGDRLALSSGGFYAEAHHIRPLGTPHHGPDTPSNILCLCPNHHAALDFGAIAIDSASLRTASDHTISDKYIQYHNRVIHRETDHAGSVLGGLASRDAS